MFIYGDVMATVAFLAGSCLCAWAMVMTCGLLFPQRVEVASASVATKPGKSIGVGLLILLTVGLAGFLCVASVPFPAVKLVGWVILLTLFLTAALGMAGIARHAGDRLRTMAPDLSAYASFSKGAGLLILGCVLPIVGWFAFLPLLYLAAIGAGCRAALAKIEEPVIAPPVAERA